MKKIKKILALVLGVAVCMGTAAFVFSGCGGKATQEFVFGADTYYGGKTYKLNLTGMSDGSCTLKCAQTSPAFEIAGTYEFSDTEGYKFDFGDKADILCGFNEYTKNHYIIYDFEITSSYSEMLMLTCLDTDFVPGDSYVDQYDAAAENLYEGEFTGGEPIKLRDYGTTFNVMSFGENAVFDHGTVAEENGVPVYTLSDGETTMKREESATVPGAYRLAYEYGDSKGTETYYLYDLNGHDKDEAFPDPRGEVQYTFTGENTTAAGTVAIGGLDCTLELWFNSDTGEREYEMLALDGTSVYLEETGTWVLEEDGDTVTFTPDDSGGGKGPGGGGFPGGDMPFTLSLSSLSAEEEVVPGGPTGGEGEQPGGSGEGEQPGGEDENSYDGSLKNGFTHTYAKQAGPTTNNFDIKFGPAVASK